MGQSKGFALLLHKQNREVAKKLGSATLLMFTLPIISFYISLHYLFPDKDDPTMWAGGVAVFFTNVVIAGYVISAFSEKNEDADSVGGDEDGPRVGAFKQRTD